MACCKCCCGNKDCAEGEQGKCCCGGSSGSCCTASQYCCDGTCESTPCTGACCDPVFGCTQSTEENCTGSGVVFKGYGVPCAPDPCLCELFWDCPCSATEGYTNADSISCCPPKTAYNAADGVCDCIDPADCPYGSGFATPAELGEIVQCCDDGSCIPALEECPP